MDPIIHKHINSLKLGDLRVFENLAIIPLFAPGESGPEYMTLQDALDQQLLKITEIDQSGSVPELKVTNTATQYVLLLDGEELMGAKQNRVVNTTILLRPNSEIIIPVSCTEEGRWAYSSADFSSSGHMMTLGLRSGKTRSVHDSLRNQGKYHSNQGQVWDDINRLSGDTKVESPTSAMRDVYESKASSLAEYEKAFEPTPQQHGLLALINGQVVGFDVLSRASAYQQLHPKLVKSYAMEAMRQQTDQSEIPSFSKAQAFLTATLDCTARHYTSVGYGDDHRFEDRTMVGSALVADETVIHLAFFKVAENEADGEAMAGYQQRREFRRGR